MLAGEVLTFDCFLTVETIIGDPRLDQGLRDKLLQSNCLSSENLKEEIYNSPLTSMLGSLIARVNRVLNNAAVFPLSPRKGEKCTGLKAACVRYLLREAEGPCSLRNLRLATVASRRPHGTTCGGAEARRGFVRSHPSQGARRMRYPAGLFAWEERNLGVKFAVCVG